MRNVSGQRGGGKGPRASGTPTCSCAPAGEGVPDRGRAQDTGRGHNDTFIVFLSKHTFFFSCDSKGLCCPCSRSHENQPPPSPGKCSPSATMSGCPPLPSVSSNPPQEAPRFSGPCSKGLREGRDPTAAGTVGFLGPPKRPPRDAGGAGAPGPPGRPSSCPPGPQQPRLGLSTGRARAHGPLCVRADDAGSFWGVIIPSSVRQRAPSPHRASGAPRLCGARDATPGWDWPPGAHTALQDTESRLSLGQSPGRGRQRCRAPQAHGRESAGPGTPRAVTAGWPRQRHSPV